nr:hypothetical protein [candidate division Zixibacteria bacterium]
MSSRNDIIFRKMTAVALLIAITGLCYLPFSNLHLHTLPDGRIIVHSHAYPDHNSNGRHNHSHQEFTLYQTLAHIYEIDAQVCIRSLPFDLIALDLLDNFDETVCPDVYISRDTERAPPQHLFS